MTADMILRAALLAVMGGVSVSVWTLRVALTAEGRKAGASLTAGIEAVVFALVFASVLSSMDSPLEITGYALGVAAGTFLGLLADGKLSTGQSAVRVIIDGDGRSLAAALEQLRWPVTRLPAEGLRGHATMLFIVVDDTRVPHLLADLGRMAPEAFWTLERLQTAHPSPLPDRYVQVHGRRRARPLRGRRAAHENTDVVRSRDDHDGQAGARRGRGRGPHGGRAPAGAAT